MMQQAAHTVGIN